MRERQRRLVTIGLAGLIAVLLAFGGALTLIRSAVSSRALDDLRAVAAWLAAQAPDLDQRSALGFAREAAARLRVRVTLIAADGVVLADSALTEQSLSGLENHIGRPEIVDARLRGQGESRRTSDTTSIEYLYVAHLVEGSGYVKYVRLALPTSQIRQVPGRHVQSLVLAMLAVSGLLGLGAWVVVRRLTRPVDRIADAAERVAAGEFALELPEQGGGGRGRLASAMRQMQRALMGKIGEVDSERSLLFSVLSAMREGLLLVDSERRVRLANRAARRIFDIEFDTAGHLLAELVRHPAIIEAVDRALEDGREVNDAPVRLTGPDRVFRLYVTPFRRSEDESPKQVLVLMFDITRLERLERVRRQFVANVSHELRTPLTSIKAAVETLSEAAVDDPATSRRFLAIIARQADRMGALIEDLTDLSMIETGAVSLHQKQLDGSAVAREVVEQLRPLARSRGVELQVELDRPLPLRADRRRLEQMLVNLIDNGLKFNHEGGYVRVRSIPDAKRPALVVEDDGIGLSDDARQQVFHRFFQVDAGRSRELGGTGLGLAIVKHLMRLHDGEVLVESELGQGSTFTLKFPPDSGQDLP